MRLFRNAPIRTKLTWLLMGVVTMALLLSYAIFVINDVRMIEEATQSHLSTLADVVAGNLIVAVYSKLPEDAMKVLQSLQSETSVVFAVVYDAQGERFADYARRGQFHSSAPPLPDCEKLFVQDGYLHVFKPILRDGHVIGTIYLQAHRQAIESQRQRIAVVVLLGLSASVAILVLVSARLQRFVSRPIQKLVDAARTVSAKADYSTRVTKTSEDELGQLCDAFNSMLSQIQQRDEALAEHGRNLERLVVERTQSLATKSEQFEIANLELTRSNSELQQFAFIASHDLQEPLRKVQAFGDLLLHKYRDKLDDEGRDYLKRMQSAATRMRALIDGLLSYSRVATKGQPFTSGDLGNIVGSVLTDLESRIEQTHGQVEVDTLPTIDADALQMRQLFQNLVGNGLKFHRPDAAPVVTITCRTMQNNGELRSSTLGVATELCEITVRDNGVGFDEQYADRMFQPFQRLHGRDQFEGTGMGLAICRKIVERHGGSISASSAPGQGATFVVTLPLTRPTRLSGSFT